MLMGVCNVVSLGSGIYRRMLHYLDIDNYNSAELFVLWLYNPNGKDFRNYVVLQIFMDPLQKRN